MGVASLKRGPCPTIFHSFFMELNKEALLKVSLKNLYWFQSYETLIFSCRPVRQALAVNNGGLLLLVVRLPQDALFWALNWIKLVQNGSNLSKMDQTCPKWTKLVQIGIILSKLDQTCPNWIKLV